MTRVTRIEFRQRYRAFLRRGIGRDDLRINRAALDQHAGATILSEQDHRQRGVRNRGKRCCHYRCGEPGALRGAPQQRRRQTAVFDRQPGEHGFGRHRLAIKARRCRETDRERIA